MHPAELEREILTACAARFSELVAIPCIFAIQMQHIRCQASRRSVAGCVHVFLQQDDVSCVHRESRQVGYALGATEIKSLQESYDISFADRH